MQFKRNLGFKSVWISKLSQVSFVRSFLSRFKNTAATPASADYEAWQQRFFLDRLGLCLWLAFLILLSFIARDLYNAVFPLAELQQMPEVMQGLWIAIDLTLTVLLSGCLLLYQTSFGQRYPAVLFFGLSWSVTIVPQVLAALRGIPLPNTLAWTMIFLIQATLIPVHWQWHLLSQLGVLLYFYGVNLLLGLTELPAISGHPERTIYDSTYLLYMLWFCFICTLAVYLYERLQRAEFESRRQAQLFLHAVSHDLRNPVTGTSLVLKKLLKEEEEAIVVPRILLERMVDSSERQLNLINSLLEVQNSEIKGIVLDRQPLALKSLVESTVSDLEPLLQERQAALVNQIPSTLPLVDADATQIWRVISNLIANALNHNPPGVTLTLSAVQDARMVRCSVQDNGVGMTPAERSRLFDLYVRGSQARRTVGLGLGLYLCRQIVVAHGGTIGVSSHPGAGATFWFTLPTAAIVGPYNRRDEVQPDRAFQ